MVKQWVKGKHKGVIWKNKMTKKDIALDKSHETHELVGDYPNVKRVKKNKAD